MEAVEAVLEQERKASNAKDARHKLTVERLRQKLVELQVNTLFDSMFAQASAVVVCEAVEQTPRVLHRLTVYLARVPCLSQYT